MVAFATPQFWKTMVSERDLAAKGHDSAIMELFGTEWNWTELKSAKKIR